MIANDGAAQEPLAAGEEAGMVLDKFLPAYHFRERHRRVIVAPRDAVWDAIGALTLAEMPVAGALFTLRSLPARLAGRPGLPHVQHQPVLAQFLDSGFVRLAEDPPREFVFGLIAQMWKWRGESAEISNGAEFLAFERPDFVKVAMNFRLSDTVGGTWLKTETRVLATDARARRGFARYWLLIRPASGLIRRVWLQAIARRATGASNTGT
jgi:hypothetical protein